MKLLIFGVLYLLSVVSTTAVGQIVKVDSGDPLPNVTWRFKAGDNLAWADSAFDVSSWQKANPGSKIDPVTATWPNNRAWFRAAFHPNQAQVDQDLSLSIKQFGSSEIYLDGKRLAELKPPLFDSGGSQRLVRFIPLRFADTNQHVLAVRYQFRRDLVYSKTAVEPMRVQIQPANEAATNAIDNKQFSGSMGAFFASIFGLLASLHLLFYRANKTSRINRTLAWTMLTFCAGLIAGETNEYVGTLTTLSVLDLIAQLSLHAGFVLSLLAVYQYLHIRRGWPFYGATGLVTLDMLYRIAVDNTPNELAWIPYVLVLTDYIRVSWLGRRSGDTDARLPWNSLRFAGYSLLLLLILLVGTGIVEGMMKIKFGGLLVVPVVLLTFVLLFSIPVGLSLSLVRDYARTHQALGENLREVEQLSARTLAQEQEKQQLLARQNELLDQQVHERTAELNQSLTELRATQMQLVQREKLASLGELTAGIAHEIQNPLNFVTNFAEVSVELVDELRTEQEQPANQRDDTLIDELLGDLGQNVQKIGEHGKRAASIVRGMLQHSRASTGQKQPTNLNALVDESMKLAYHGLRATDKNFNAELKTDFASNLPNALVVPEDVGRVLVNLFNNAFYAVKQANSATADSQTPTVSARTSLNNGQIEIRIADNGPGIPDAVRQKIFQPFFTTKPTGQGTGLGLSISHDIIAKGHGGTLSVDTEPGKTEFTVRLPA